MTEHTNREDYEAGLRFILANVAGDDDRHKYGEFRDWCDECQSVQHNLVEAMALFDQQISKATLEGRKEGEQAELTYLEVNVGLCDNPTLFSVEKYLSMRHEQLAQLSTQKKGDR